MAEKSLVLAEREGFSVSSARLDENPINSAHSGAPAKIVCTGILYRPQPMRPPRIVRESFDLGCLSATHPDGFERSRDDIDMPDFYDHDH